MPSATPDPAYHLLRVRVRKGIFARLQQIAEDETAETDEYTTVSDIVRSAILDWISGHDADEAMARNGRFMPSGIAMPPIDFVIDNDDADE
jgi:hypothetical protein